PRVPPSASATSRYASGWASFRSKSAPAPRRGPKQPDGAPLSVRRKVAALQSIDAAIVLAKMPTLGESKPKPLVEAVCPHVAGERIDDHRGHGRVTETAAQRQPHHPRAVAFLQLGRLADPDIDRPQPERNVAP